MLRRDLIAAAMALGLAPLAVSAQETTLNVGMVGGSEAPEVVAMQEFAEEISNETDGEIAVRVQSGGALGGDRDVIEGLQIGTVDMAVPSTSIVANFYEPMKIFDIPFLFRDFDHAEAVLNGPIGDQMLEELPDHGLVGLALGGMGFRQLTNSVQPVHEAADVEGLKIRTQQNETHIRVWTELGVLPTPMAIPEVYTALQQGVVDGQENPIGAIVNNRFGEVQDYVSMTNHAFTPLVVLISPATWNQLDEDQQAIFRSAADTAMQRNRELAEQSVEDGLDTLREQGVEVITDVDRESFRTELEGLFEQFSEEFDAERLAQIRDTE